LAEYQQARRLLQVSSFWQRSATETGGLSAPVSAHGAEGKGFALPRLSSLCGAALVGEVYNPMERCWPALGWSTLNYSGWASLLNIR